MAGFFKGVGRFLSGQPVFQAGDDTQASSSAQPGTPAGMQPAAPPVSVVNEPLPFVNIRNWEHDYPGANLQINLTFHNTSQKHLELERIIFLGHETEFEEMLEPGEVRELKAYYGTPLTSSSYNSAEVWYKDEQHRMLRSMFTLEYRVNAQGHYEITRFRFFPPVRVQR